MDQTITRSNHAAARGNLVLLRLYYKSQSGLPNIEVPGLFTTTIGVPVIAI